MFFYNYKKPVISTSICIYDGYISIYLHVLATIIVSVSYYVHTIQRTTFWVRCRCILKHMYNHYYNWNITDMEQYAPSAGTCMYMPSIKIRHITIGTLLGASQQAQNIVAIYQPALPI